MRPDPHVTMNITEKATRMVKESISLSKFFIFVLFCKLILLNIVLINPLKIGLAQTFQ